MEEEYVDEVQEHSKFKEGRCDYIVNYRALARERGPGHGTYLDVPVSHSKYLRTEAM